MASVILGGITYVSSSGIVAKLLHDFGSIGNLETPFILSILVIEDLAMALFLPVVGGLLIGGSTLAGLGTAIAAVAGVIVFLALAMRVEVGLSRMIFSHSDEALLLTLLGITFVVAGLAELVQVSAAVTALIIGIALSGPAADGARALLGPLRDLFAAMFFAFVGFSIDPSDIPPVLGIALVLAFAGALTKLATGWFGAARAGAGIQGRVRAGATLIARGEFSIAVAGLAVAGGVQAELPALAVSYVLLLAILGPIAVRLTEPVLKRLGRRPETVPDSA